MTLKHGPERRTHFPQLGTIEHLEQALNGFDGMPLWHKDQLAPALETFLLPQSLADFIFQNQTYDFVRAKLRNLPPSTAVIDTRHLTGYVGDPFIDAEFKYDPRMDNNYLSILGRRRFAYDSDLVLSYFLSMGLRNNFDLDRRQPIEAHLTAGDPPIAKLLFRSQAQEDVKALKIHMSYGESNPRIFAGVLGEVINGLKDYLYIRANRF